MKVTIIGAAGRVGANCAFALQQSPLVQEMVLVDVANDLARGEALDLRHGTSLAQPQQIYNGDYDEAENSDIVIVTAGLRRKPEESRLELVGRNVSLFKQILESVSQVKLAADAILLIVTNPVDILTHLAAQKFGWPWGRVIGTGTMLDTARFRSLLSERLGVAADEVNALILGEHGDSMVPVWSTASVNGVPLLDFPGFGEAARAEVAEATRRSGAEVIRLKGGAGYAIALATKALVEAIAGDHKSVLPVSTPQRGSLGISDVSLSLPTRLGRAGAEEIIPIRLNDEEQAALQKSADALKQILAGVA